MFGSSASPVAGIDLRPAELDDRTEAQWQAIVDAQIAADPEPWPDLGAAERRARAADVIEAAERSTVEPTMVGQLADIEPDALAEDEVLGLAAAWQRVANYCEAQRTRAVAALVTVSPDKASVPRELHASGQLGAALGLGSGATDAMISASLELTSRLRPTLRAMAEGSLSWRKASSLAAAIGELTDEQVTAVEDKVLAKAPERSPSRHDAAVRRAVDQVDPDGADRKRRQRLRDIRLVKHHYGAGMGQLFLDAPSEWVDAIDTAATSYARRLKAAGDPRTLQLLRVHYFYAAATSQLTHGDPTYCERNCGPGRPDTHDDGEEPQPGGTPPEESSAPSRHGRPVTLHVVWDLTSLLGLTSHCGLLADSDTLLPPAAVRTLLAGGARIRRMIIDPDTGEQLDLTPVTWLLPPTDGRTHRQPVLLTLTTPARLDQLPDALRGAIDGLDPAFAVTLRALLDHPVTADDLDRTPHAETPSPALAEFTASRAAHPVNPCAGPTAAGAGDNDHHLARSAGGQTVRANLGPLVRRWHRLKTFSDWTVDQINRTWRWTSPTGRRYTVEPHDYRLGP